MGKPEMGQLETGHFMQLISGAYCIFCNLKLEFEAKFMEIKSLFYQVLIVWGSGNPGLASQASCCRDYGSQFRC